MIDPGKEPPCPLPPPSLPSTLRLWRTPVFPDCPPNAKPSAATCWTAVTRIRPILEADAEANDAAASLSWPSVVSLYQEGLLSLKVPRELGGPEVDALLYLELIDEISYINPSAGWCAFINSTSTAWMGAFLPDSAVSEIFVDDRMPIASGAIIPRGLGTPVDGGWKISGRWALRQRFGTFLLDIRRVPHCPRRPARSRSTWSCPSPSVTCSSSITGR